VVVTPAPLAPVLPALFGRRSVMMIKVHIDLAPLKTRCVRRARLRAPPAQSHAPILPSRARSRSF
jgi:hypothetical protein